MDELLRQFTSLSSVEKYRFLQELRADYSGIKLFALNGCIAYSARTLVINNPSSDSIQTILDVIAEEIGQSNKSES